MPYVKGRSGAACWHGSTDLMRDSSCITSMALLVV